MQTAPTRARREFLRWITASWIPQSIWTTRGQCVGQKRRQEKESASNAKHSPVRVCVACVDSTTTEEKEWKDIAELRLGHCANTTTTEREKEK